MPRVEILQSFDRQWIVYVNGRIHKIVQTEDEAKREKVSLSLSFFDLVSAAS